MLIRNFNHLGTCRKRADTLRIISAGIDSVRAANAVPAGVARFLAQKSQTVTDAGRVFVIGFGKSSGHMAEALEKTLGVDALEYGVVVCTQASCTTRKITILEGSHPFPDRRSIAATRKILKIPEKFRLTRDDVVICLVSGGGSALLCCPAGDIRLRDLTAINRLLIGSGADIRSINTVRKKISRVKGGKLAGLYQPAAIESFIISDVIGGNPDMIASGPTYPDTATFKDAWKIIEKLGIIEKVPDRIRTHIRQGMRDEKKKPAAVDTQQVDNHIIADNRIALKAMEAEARRLGYRPAVLSDRQQGDTEKTAVQAIQAVQRRQNGKNCFLAGGETTVTLPAAHGKGGRNQHYAAVTLNYMACNNLDITLASVGSDGSDFSYDVAGAIVDSSTVERSCAKNINIVPYIERCDSFTLLRRIGRGLVKTGNTGTNVCDLRVYLT